jgi:CRISPR-associated endoribonuclease Cas6
VIILLVGVDWLPVEVGLEMYGEKPVVLPFFTGYVSRGLLLHFFGRVDPVLAGVLHEADRPKPYSVTPLRFKSVEKSEKGYLMDCGFPCRVWFRFLRDDLAKRVLEYFYKNTDVLIYDTVFKVASLRFKSESYEELCNSVREPAESFRLHFDTPTYLASSGTDFRYLFPDHVRIFPSLMRLWNLFSDERKFSKEEFLEYKEWLLKNVGVSQHMLKTRIAFMREKKAVGFVGWATYEIKALGEWNKVTQVLAKFAEYSNVGGNRTGGFGVAQLRGKKKREE